MTGLLDSRPAAKGRFSSTRGYLSSTFSSLAVRDFRYLWLGTFVTQIGIWIQIVAQGWLAYELTDSATFLGAVSLANGLPSLLLVLPAGVIADRWNRQRILLISQFVMMLNAIALTALVATGLVQAWHLLITEFVGATAMTINLPARQTLAPQLAGDRYLANAVALNAISFNTSRVIGPALAGMLIGFVGLPACFFVQAAGFIWTMYCTVRVGSSAGSLAREQEGSIWANLLDGLRYIRRTPLLLALLIAGGAPIVFGMAYVNLMPVFARDVLQIGATGLGTMMSAVGIGAMVGAFVTAGLSSYPRKGLAQLVSAAAFGVSLVVFAVSPWLALTLVSLALVGCFQALTQAVNQTILMITTPNEYRGRVISVFMMGWGLQPTVVLPAGWLTDQVGAPPTMLILGCIVIATVVLAAVRAPAIREFRDEPSPSVLAHS